MQVRVFDPFFTTKSPGHGLGLSIIYGIIRGLNGAIQVLSDPGKGTKVQILLPPAETMAGDADRGIAGKTDLAGQIPHASVLVVEDEDYLRQAVVKTLHRAGIRVFEAGDGSTAIELLRTNAGNVDLILLDMTIPGASSAEVMSEAGKSCPQTGVILTSAYSAEMLADTLRKPQIRCFIRKPFRLADLMGTIQDALRESKNVV
jgi:CheY-like chemotaxis protein